jgi:hypothetical protein
VRKTLAGALAVLTLSVPQSTKPRPLIGQGGSPPSVTEYFKPSPVDGPHFGLAAEIVGNDTPGVPSYKVAGYFAAETASRGDDAYALNAVAQWNKGDPRSNIIGFEVDLNNNHSDVGAYQAPWVHGALIASGGAFHPGTALLFGSTSPENSWRIGIDIPAKSVSDVGIKIGGPTPGLEGSVLIKQLRNGSDTLLLQRFTDTKPVGAYLRVVNAVNNKELFVIDIEGRVFAHELHDDGQRLLTLIRRLESDVAELKKRR